MQMVRWDPFGMMRDFDRRTEADTQRERRWVPRLDAFDADGTLTIRVETPGITADDIDVTVENGKLTVSGSRSFSSEGGSYHRKEIFEGSFRRTLFLPDTADVEEIGATSRDGILEITVPTKAEALPKKVTVDIQS